MKNRNIFVMILLSIFTLGIYPLYWFTSFQMELKRKTGEGFGGFAHFILLFITFGIYAIYWQYAAGKRLAKQGADDNSLLYLILTLISLGFINPFIMQNQANQLK